MEILRKNNMDMVCIALIFTTVILFGLMAVCFLILRENDRVEKENAELKEKLETWEQERRVFSH